MVVVALQYVVVLYMFLHMCCFVACSYSVFYVLPRVCEGLVVPCFHYYYVCEVGVFCCCVFVYICLVCTLCIVRIVCDFICVGV